MPHSTEDSFPLRVAAEPFEVLRGHIYPIYMARFSPDGQFLVSADGRSLCLWKWDKQKHYVLHHIVETMTDTVAISHDGRLIASLEENRVFLNKVHLWSPEGELIASLSHRGEEYALVFSPEEPLLVVADASGRLQLWDMITFTLLCESEVPPESAQTHLNNAVRYLAFAPDGRHLAVQWYTNYGAVQIVEIAQAEGTTSPWSLKWSASVLPSMLPAQSIVSALSFSPDWRYLAVASNREYRIWLLDAFSLETVGALEVPSSAEGIAAITFSSEGAYLAMAGCNGAVWIWDVASQRQVEVFHAHESRIGGYASVIGSIDWSPDGRWLLTTGTGLLQPSGSGQEKNLSKEVPDATIKLWNVEKKSLKPL